MSAAQPLPAPPCPAPPALPSPAAVRAAAAAVPLPPPPPDGAGGALSRAARAACADGLLGAAAAAAQTCAFMWLNTTVALQHGTGVRGTRAALRNLYAEGGVRRMYSGLGAAALYGALARLGDVGANAGVLGALQGTEGVGVVGKTAVASGVAAVLRVGLVPLEAAKHNMQIRGFERGTRLMASRVQVAGVRGLWHGSAATAAAAFAMHFPFFLTVNYASGALPPLAADATVVDSAARNGGVGFAAAVAADASSNAFKVVATTQQTSRLVVGAQHVVGRIVGEEGVLGLVTRGLKTRMLNNALQGAFFVIVWKELEERYAGHRAPRDPRR
jgi:hypothetical protein